MKKELADLVDAAIPAAFGLIFLAVPGVFVKKDSPDREARLRKVRLIAGVLVTIGAAMVALQLAR